MELIPALEMGWLNGWIPLCLLCLVDGILFSAFPKDVVARLFDRSGWSRTQRIFFVIGKLLAFRNYSGYPLVQGMKGLPAKAS